MEKLIVFLYFCPAILDRINIQLTQCSDGEYTTSGIFIIIFDCKRDRHCIVQVSNREVVGSWTECWCVYASIISVGEISKVAASKRHSYVICSVLKSQSSGRWTWHTRLNSIWNILETTMKNIMSEWRERTYEPCHEKPCLCHMRTTKAPISTFVVHCVDSIISSFYIRNFKPLASFCGCAGQFESSLVENPEDRFSRDVAHVRFKSWRPRSDWSFRNCITRVLHCLHLSRDMTKPTKWLCTQRRLKSAWASAQSNQCLCCPHEGSLGP